MPRGKHRFGLVGGMVMVLALTSCATPAPTVHSSAPIPVATPTPAFTSDADALAAAVDLYRRYSALEDQSLSGSIAAERSLSQYMSPADYTDDVATTSQFLEKGERFVGTSQIGRVKVQRIDAASGKVSFYACLDLSKTRIVDSKGRDVTPRNRGVAQTVVVTEQGLPTLPILLESTQWSGASIC